MSIYSGWQNNKKYAVVWEVAAKSSHDGAKKKDVNNSDTVWHAKTEKKNKWIKENLKKDN